MSAVSTKKIKNKLNSHQVIPPQQYHTLHITLCFIDFLLKIWRHSVLDWFNRSVVGSTGTTTLLNKKISLKNAHMLKVMPDGRIVFKVRVDEKGNIGAKGTPVLLLCKLTGKDRSCIQVSSYK